LYLEQEASVAAIITWEGNERYLDLSRPDDGQP